MRLPVLTAALAVAAALGACGREPLDAPDTAPDELGAVTRVLDFPAAGVTGKIPLRAQAMPQPAPGVFRISLGAGFVSCFAYRRSEPIPKGRQQLAAARRRLVGEVGRRGGRFDVQGSRTLQIAGSDAVEVKGTQTISRQRLKTRSLHVFKGRAEYVFELLQPPSSFTQVERSVFDPMLVSLKLSGRVQVSAADEARRQIEKAVEPTEP
ncbi:MAG: hypothetical protein ACR2NH_05485 [Solirubrobacteraceae bacterium]